MVNLEVRLPAEELATAVDEGFPQVAAREDDWNDAATLMEIQLMPLEEHVLWAASVAERYLKAG